MPKRIQLSRRKGFRLPPNTVNCARPGKWGNPYYIRKGGDTTKVVAVFREDLLAAQNGTLSGYRRYIWRKNHRLGADGPYWMIEHLHELAGKDLACWCPLDAPCHADVLLELANAPAEIEAARKAQS